MRFIKQFDVTDCGPACLAMMADHFGVYFSLAQLRSMASTTQRGTNLKGMVDAARSMGFHTQVLKGTPDNFAPDLPVPFIAHIKKTTGETHFVVVLKIKSEDLLVMDPGVGKTRLLLADFLAEWSGYCLFLNPTPEFRASKYKRPSLGMYLPVILPHWRNLVLVFLATLSLTLFGGLNSLIVQFIIDNTLESKAEGTLQVLSFGAILITFFSGTLVFIRAQILQLFSIKTSLSLSLSFLKQILHLPMNFFDQRKLGDILTRFEDGEKVRTTLSDIFLNAFLDMLLVIFSGIFLALVNLSLFLILLAVLVLSLITSIFYSFFYSKNYRRQMIHAADTQSLLVESLYAVATLKAFNHEETIFKKLESHIVRMEGLEKASADKRNSENLLSGLLVGVGANLTFWFGSYFILKDSFTLGQLMSFNMFSSFFIAPIQRFISFQPKLQEALVASERMGEILALPTEMEPSENLHKLKSVRGEITFRNVSFRYGSNRLLFTHLNLDIAAGSKVALVGRSGCGKSTFVKLLLKFYFQEEGDILLDGFNLKDLDTASMRSKIGYVPQELNFFSATIKENISLFDPGISDKDIFEAAAMAEFDQFAGSLAERYQTRLGEGGINLSGGEKQRLAIARALVRKPAILVLDEATSSMDNITERSLTGTLKKLRKTGVTIITIAHRLTTITDSDQIFLLENGYVSEKGTHEQLLNLKGSYSSLWENQKNE